MPMKLAQPDFRSAMHACEAMLAAFDASSAALTSFGAACAAMQATLASAASPSFEMEISRSRSSDLRGVVRAVLHCAAQCHCHEVAPRRCAQ